MTLPIDRSTLALAQGNQVPYQVASSSKNINFLKVVADTIDELNVKVDAHAASVLLPHTDGSVSTAKIADAAVTTPKLAPQSVTSSRIANGAVGALQLDPTFTNNFTPIAIQAEFDRRGVSVGKYGAIGDGTSHPLSERYPSLVLAQMMYTFATSLTDEIDWCAIQATINAVHASGGGVVLLPHGTFMANKPLLALAARNFSGVGDTPLTIIGESIAGTTIKKTTTAVIGNGLVWDIDTIINCGSDYIWSYTGGTADDPNNVCCQLTIENIQLDRSGTRAGKGIYFPLSSHTITLRNFAVWNCISSVESTNNFFLSEISYFRLYNGQYGLNLFNTGIKTSLTISEGYCVGQTTTAYAIKGAIYSNMVNCCADGVSGTVYDLSFVDMALTGCGTESILATKFYNITNSSVTLNNCETFSNTTNAAATIFSLQGSNVTMIGGKYGYSATSAGKMFSLVVSNVQILNTTLGATSTADVIGDNCNLFKTYGNNMNAFKKGLGNFLGNSNQNIQLEYGANAWTLDDGTNHGFYTEYTQGTIALSKRPLAIGGAGWVIVDDTAVSLGTVSAVAGNTITLTDLTLDKSATYGLYFRSNLAVTSTSGASAVISSVNVAAKTITMFGGFGGVFNVGDFIQVVKGNRSNVHVAKIPLLISGATAQRPTVSLVSGQPYYDTTLDLPIYWNATAVSWKKYSDNTNV